VFDLLDICKNLKRWHFKFKRVGKVNRDFKAGLGSRCFVGKIY
jgi:hypothetical protein